MEYLLPAYDDPLFSIILIILVSLLIALLTYGWGIHKQHKEEGNLLRFLDTFESAECRLDTSTMVFENNMLKPLTLLATAFENTGEYHKSINIYLYLIKHIEQTQGQLELMERLGSTYLHAGFLERSRSIYLEILRKQPRNKQVLKELGIVYEMLHDYEKAQEILEPLAILGENTHDLEVFLHLSSLLHDKGKTPQDKVLGLKGIFQKEPSLYRPIISALFQLDTQSAWEYIHLNRIEEILDILWFLPQSQINEERICQDKALQTLYYAKGYLPLALSQSDIFNLDIIATAKAQGHEEIDLSFSYLCNKCKQSFPMSFRRCPSCMCINSLKVDTNIVKKQIHTGFSLL